MTLSEAHQKFDLRWTILSAAVVLLASGQLLQLSKASLFFCSCCISAMATAGLAARRALADENPVPRFMFVQRLRMITLVVMAVAAATAVHANKTLLAILAGATLWLVSVSGLLQIVTRFAPSQNRFCPYLQFLGDFWVAIFLAIWGVDWLYTAGVMAIAVPTATAIVPPRDPRFLPTSLLATAALFLFGVPTSARGFAVHMIATIALATWSAHHLMALAGHLRPLTASASDGSIAH